MHVPALIQDLALILGVAAVVTFLFQRIKQPVVLGYVVAGIIVGPYTPAILSVTDTSSIQVWAELGVIFLMFALGLEFSFRRLTKVGMSAGITALIQVVSMLVLGVLTARALNWTSMDAVFLGCMIAISSTTIIIKALEGFGLKSQRFAELVFAILIVEDLIAILMLVALTNIATTASVGGIELLMAGGKLAIVVGAWFLVGIFVVPRFIKAVSRHGNDEMLTVVAMALCLALVVLAASFHYSVALGAFIMGSILAESSEAKRIEHLVQPLKDIFGAVFFVSVGMLLDPRTILDNLGAVTLISAVIVIGKLVSVAFGAFATGQTIANSTKAGFSMAQVGEFSFIIASLGLTYNVVSDKIYPIIVAASVVTTFTTPYLIRSSTFVVDYLDRRLPPRVKTTLEQYGTWVGQRTVTSANRKNIQRSTIKWTLNAVLVVTVFALVAEKLVPLIREYIAEVFAARALAWAIAFTLSSPSIYAMLTAFRNTENKSHGGLLVAARIATLFMIGLLSVGYFSALGALGVTVGLGFAGFLIFRRQIENYYKWLEDQFRSGFQADMSVEDRGHGQGQEINPISEAQKSKVKGHARLAPWNARLTEIKVPVRSSVVGQSLVSLKLREKYGLNVVVIVRGDESIVAPKAKESLYPGDILLCFGTDTEIDRFRDDLKSTPLPQVIGTDLEAYHLRRFIVMQNARVEGSTIHSSGIRESFECIVVGLERLNEQIRSPSSELALIAGDILWIVGEGKKLHRLELEFGTT